MKPVQETVMIRSMSSGLRSARERHFSAASIPSLDAHLIHQMGFRPNVRRMPFTELGCAAGAMALGRAADYLKAHPGGNVLIIAVELPSLTFQRKDISQANLISSILFGDGAAAVIVRGNPAPGPKILVSETY